MCDPLIPFTVLEAAELYRAEELEEYLRDFKEHNGMLLDTLIPKESSEWVFSHFVLTLQQH